MYILLRYCSCRIILTQLTAFLVCGYLSLARKQIQMLSEIFGQEHILETHLLAWHGATEAEAARHIRRTTEADAHKQFQQWKQGRKHDQADIRFSRSRGDSVP
jgi:hypothetical protein